MSPNTSSPRGPAAGPAAAPATLPAGVDGLPAGPDGLPAGLGRLAAAVAGLAADDLDRLGGALLAAQVLAVRRLGDQLEGVWLRRLAAAAGRRVRTARPGMPRLGLRRPLGGGHVVASPCT